MCSVVEYRNIALTEEIDRAFPARGGDVGDAIAAILLRELYRGLVVDVAVTNSSVR